VTDDQREALRTVVEHEPWQEVPNPLARSESPPDILLWKPSLVVLLLSGIGAGTVLGVSNALLCHAIVGTFASPQAAGCWGAVLGLAGGVLVVAVRRAVWGPDISVEIGTVLGLLYGIAPGLAVLFQAMVVNRSIGTWRLTGLVMAGSMAGLILGGVLDRITEAVLARVKRSRGEPDAAPERGRR
jgi:hypothetical protein